MTAGATEPAFGAALRWAPAPPRLAPVSLLITWLTAAASLLLAAGVIPGVTIPSAGGALVLVTGVGIAVRAPLARVPDNAMKFAVGVMLTTFGIFWSAEGAGAHWPGEDASLLGVLGFVVLASFVLVRLLRRERRMQLRTAQVQA